MITAAIMFFVFVIVCVAAFLPWLLKGQDVTDVPFPERNPTPEERIEKLERQVQVLKSRLEGLVYRDIPKEQRNNIWKINWEEEWPE